MSINFLKEGKIMPSKKRTMSENLKEEIAKELGVYETVKQDGGWGNVSSKDCGNMVTKAIEIANKKA
jgi:small acid-soluble spore protein F (minor alpha/beta-type SASP)